MTRSAVSRIPVILLAASIYSFWPSAGDAQVMEVLHSFSGCPQTGCAVGSPYDGAHPRSALVFGDGQLYGTTYGGGSGNGVGSVFRITTAGSITNLWAFGYGDVPPAFFGQNGAFPIAPLVQGSDGALYGVAPQGGLYDDGTFFTTSTAGVFSKVLDFNDGAASTPLPWGAVAAAPDGTFYGTTQFGGVPGVGTVYRIGTDLSVTDIHTFTGADGQWPRGHVFRASDGSIYGTTWTGGGGCSGGYGGCGVIFKIASNGTFSVVHAFTGTDGGEPEEVGMIEAPDGSIYGLTTGGGVVPNVCGNCGTIFRINPEGTFQSLYAFDNVTGCGPRGALLLASDGNFYGTTTGCFTGEYGTIFRMTPEGTVILVHEFQGPEGARPFGGLVEGSDGTLYGTTYDGGANGLGVVFKLTLPRAQNGTLDATEDTSANGTLSATDPSNAQLTFSLVSQPGKGSVTITDTSTGAYTYTPNNDANGSDTFTFKANNGVMDTNVATVTVTIAAVNDPPQASDDSTTVAAGSSTSGVLSAADIDSQTLTFSIVSNGTKGTAAVTNASTGAYTYTANSGTSGSDSFTFKANDGSADSNVATVTVTITGGSTCAAVITATVTVSGPAPKLNRKTGRYTQNVALKNADGAIAGPVSLVLDGLSSNATVVNPGGTTSCAAPAGQPFVNVDVGGDGVFGVRERATVTLEFTNPSGQPITYTPRVLAGSNR